MTCISYKIHSFIRRLFESMSNFWNFKVPAIWERGHPTLFQTSYLTPWWFPTTSYLNKYYLLTVGRHYMQFQAKLISQATHLHPQYGDLEGNYFFSPFAYRGHIHHITKLGDVAQKKWAKSDIIREMDLAVTMLLHDNTDTENAL